MASTRANALTIVFDHGHRTRTRTFTGGIRYGFTWNRIFVKVPGGAIREYDRINVLDVQATNNHAAPAA